MLKFNAEHQTITRIDSFSPVADSRNYLMASFIMSEEWSGDIIVIFGHNGSYYHQKLEGGRCLVPWEVIRAPYFTVSLFCGDLVTANTVHVAVAPSGMEDGEVPGTPTQTVFRQMLEQIDGACDNANTAAENANAAAENANAAAEKATADSEAAMQTAADAADTANTAAENATTAAENAESAAETANTAAENANAAAETVQSVKIAKTDQNNNFTAPQTINGTLTVNGDIVQNGAAYETHAEQLYTKNDMLITREGAVGGLGAGELTGIEAEKYDGEHSGVLAFDADGTARVGDKGDEQPLLTRAESENLSDGQVMTWNAENQRAEGSSSYVKNTDYASSEKAGVIKRGNGLNIADNGVPFASARTSAQYKTDPVNVFLSKGTLENIKEDMVRGVLPQVADTLPSTLAANTEYYLGESAAVSFAFPETGALGQYCFVKLDSGDTAATLTVTGENYVGDLPSPKANTTYEILATWNGSKWVCSYRGY